MAVFLQVQKSSFKLKFFAPLKLIEVLHFTFFVSLNQSLIVHPCTLGEKLSYVPQQTSLLMMSAAAVTDSKAISSI